MKIYMTVHNRGSIPILRNVLVNVTFHKLGGGARTSHCLFFIQA